MTACARHSMQPLCQVHVGPQNVSNRVETDTFFSTVCHHKEFGNNYFIQTPNIQTKRILWATADRVRVFTVDLVHVSVWELSYACSNTV